LKNVEEVSAMTESNKALEVRDKQEMAIPVEHTDSRLVLTPEVDIFETDRDIVLLVDMPGVSTEGLDISLKDGVLTLSGKVRPWETPNESDVLVEFEIGQYFRRFTVPKQVDQDRIEARLEDGVLHLTLPKSEKALPRQITVKA
jgi:HSP20 family molecular chaperone IbpA